MMRRILLAAIASLALVGNAAAQFPGYPASGNLQIGQGSTAPPAWNPLNGDCTSTNLGAIVCTKTNGVVFYTGLPAPVNPNDAATKAYVDANSVGLTIHPSVVLATTTALPANTYNNGTAGVGATLTSTCVSSCPAPTIDGSAVTLGQRILVKNEAAPANNGIYTVSTVGTGTTPYVLTRATDANTPGLQNANEIGQGTFVLVSSGSVGTNTGWAVTSSVTTIGTSAINWAQFSASGGGVVSFGGMIGIITCGGGLTCGGGIATATIPARVILSNDSGSPNTVLDIAPGAVADSTNAVMIKIGAFTKSTAGAWASGSGGNGMGNGLTVAASTWYHVCLANNAGTPDIWFDTSAVCANRPGGISDTKFRRIGSFITNASSNILAFTQTGNYFYWAAPTSDLTTSSLTSGTDLTLTVPLGVSTIPLLAIITNCTATGGLLNVGASLSKAGGSTYSVSVLNIDAQAGQSNTQQNNVIGPPTNTSSQVRYSLSLGTGTASFLNFRIVTQGWIDTSL